MLLLVIKIKIKVQYEKGQYFSFIISSISLFVIFALSQLISIYYSWNIIFRVYCILVSLLSLIIQLGYPLLHHKIIEEKSLEDEKKMLENIVTLQGKQQEMNKQTVDVLNLKFHDLKNQLLVLSKLEGIEKENNFNELKNNLDIYSSFTKSGNEILDVVLTQKSLICSSNNIRLTYIIDGKSCLFLSNTDLTSLFGNILDNAIEAVEKEKDNYRIIKLQVFTKNGFLIISEENYCHEELIFKEGRPISSKNNPNYHGFGIKSIEYVVQKYNGSTKIDFSNNIFKLSILIPIPIENEQKELSNYGKQTNND